MLLLVFTDLSPKPICSLEVQTQLGRQTPTKAHNGTPKFQSGPMKGPKTPRMVSDTLSQQAHGPEKPGS